MTAVAPAPIISRIVAEVRLYDMWANKTIRFPAVVQADQSSALGSSLADAIKAAKALAGSDGVIAVSAGENGAFLGAEVALDARIASVMSRQPLPADFYPSVAAIDPATKGLVIGQEYWEAQPAQ